MTHKILTVDDHPDTLNAVIDTLTGYGYVVLSSLSPFEGLEIAEAEHPDLILLDVNMPGMSGTEMARQIRASEQLAQTPIIMFTAERLPEQKLGGFDSGADDYLIKPTDPEMLISRIRAILGEPNEPQPVAVAAQLTPPAVATPTASGRVIGLVGAHGGAGTTTLAFNLALAIAETGQSTTLVDYDLAQGHLALYLNHKRFNHGLNQFAQQPADAYNVHNNLIRHADNLRLLLAEPNPVGDVPLPDSDHNTALMQTLSEMGDYVIIDMGRNLDATTHPLIEWADDIYVCVQPNRVGLASARYLIHKLEKVMVTDTYLAAIGFHIGSSSLRRSPIEQYLKRPLLAMVTVHPKEMTRSINQTIPLIHMEQSPAGEAIRRLADKIISR